MIVDVLKEATEKLAGGEHLTREEARQVSLGMLTGDVPDAVIGGLLIGLKTNGETPEEIAGFAQGMREVKVTIHPRTSTLVDTCGTGGDRMGTFNISTAAALITAACGVPVAKHGNRGVSSTCGSADVLEAMGVDLAMEPDRVCECIEQVGIGFMFAPGFHPAMKQVMSARKALGVPTIFNILGPLTNPAGAKAQVLGVGRAGLAPVMAGVLSELGCERGYVLHGMDGMDEFTLTTGTFVYEVDPAGVLRMEMAPEDLGLPRCPLEALAGGGPEENARLLRSILAGEPGPMLDISVANAAFAVTAGGATGTVLEGVEMAGEAVASGEAARVLERLVEFQASGGSDVPR